jgi:hypothetical protein
MTSMTSLMRDLPIGAHEEPLVVELVGTVTVRDLVKALKEAYKEAGPRCGANIVPAWKLRDAKKKSKALKGRKEEEEGASDPNSTAGNPLRIVLRRPVTLKSASSNNCKIMLQSTSLVVASHSVALENCDISGYGRSGVSWDETIGLLEVSEGGDCELKNCNLSMLPPPTPVTLSPDKGPKKRSLTASPSKLPPVTNCSIVLVQDGGRVTADTCTFTGSPIASGYGVVVRGQRTRLLLEGCQATENYFSNVLVSHGAQASLINCNLAHSKEGYGLSASDSFTQVYCKDSTFDSNSRDNCYSVNKAKVILEDCRLQGSQTRSGLRVEGDGSVAVARVSAFDSNSEHAIRVSWGGWASAKGCEYVGYDGRGTMTLSEAVTGRRSNGTIKGSSRRSGAGGSSFLSGVDEEDEDEEIRTAVEEMESIIAEREAEKDIALIEGPSSTLLQDLSLGRPSWKYISTMERPWTKPEITTVTLRS